jgi:hypothetical protein
MMSNEEERLAYQEKMQSQRVDFDHREVQQSLLLLRVDCGEKSNQIHLLTQQRGYEHEKAGVGRKGEGRERR